MTSLLINTKIIMHLKANNQSYFIQNSNLKYKSKLYKIYYIYIYIYIHICGLIHHQTLSELRHDLQSTIIIGAFL